MIKRGHFIFPASTRPAGHLHLDDQRWEEGGVPQDTRQDRPLLHDRRGVRPGLRDPPDGLLEGRRQGADAVLTLYKWSPGDQCFGS